MSRSFSPVMLSALLLAFGLAAILFVVDHSAPDSALQIPLLILATVAGGALPAEWSRRLGYEPNPLRAALEGAASGLLAGVALVVGGILAFIRYAPPPPSGMPGDAVEMAVRAASPAVFSLVVLAAAGGLIAGALIGRRRAIA